LFVSARASSSAKSFADLDAVAVDDAAGLRTEARAEMGVPLVPDLTEPVLTTPFGVDGAVGVLTFLEALGDPAPLDGDVRPLGVAVDGLLRFEDDMAAWS